VTMKDPRTPSNLKINCENAGSLVQSYLDSELTETQAAPLREHLLDCPSCRETAKGGRTLRRWFQESQDGPGEFGEVLAPEGFASRVARRAFAGDPGLLIPEPRRSLLPFLLAATAVAAGALLIFSIVIQRQTIPTSGTMSADDYQPPWEDRAAEDRWAIDEVAPPTYSVPPGLPVAPETAEGGDGEEPANADKPTRYVEEKPEDD